MARPFTVFYLKTVEAGLLLSNFLVNCQVPFETVRMRIRTKVDSQNNMDRELDSALVYMVVCEQLGNVSQVIEGETGDTDYYFPMPTVVRQTLKFSLRVPNEGETEPEELACANATIVGFELTFYPAGF